VKGGTALRITLEGQRSNLGHVQENTLYQDAEAEVFVLNIPSLIQIVEGNVHLLDIFKDMFCFGKCQETLNREVWEIDGSEEGWQTNITEEPTSHGKDKDIILGRRWMVLEVVLTTWIGEVPDDDHPDLHGEVDRRGRYLEGNRIETGIKSMVYIWQYVRGRASGARTASSTACAHCSKAGMESTTNRTDHWSSFSESSGSSIPIAFACRKARAAKMQLG
jgi:hypothetical protein